MKVESFEPKQNLNINHRKQSGFDRAYIVITREGKTIADLRTYWPGQRCYACLWVFAGDYANGSGFAGGGGYDKRSAAADAAFTSAGVTLDRHFHGTGETFKAMEALGQYLAGDNFLTVIETCG